MIESVRQDISDDALLNGRVRLRQPVDGYRVAMDTVFLAASVQAQPGETVLDVGTGVGAAALCLAVRCPGVRVTGLEIQWSLLKLATDNVLLNNLRDRVEMVFGDLQNPPPRLTAGTFSHVMANPPYLDAVKARVSDNPVKATATASSATDLAQWVRFCLLMAKPKGLVTFIHRADRLGDLMQCLTGKIGEITIFPLWSHANKPAKRIIVQGRKNSQAPLALMPGLVLHQEDGQYTSQAQAILRDGQALSLVRP